MISEKQNRIVIEQQATPVAYLERSGNRWFVTYITDEDTGKVVAQKPLMPNLPLRTRPFEFDHCPNFLVSLLPQGDRLEKIIGSDNPLTPKRFEALFARILDQEVIGDIQTFYQGRDEDFEVNKEAGRNYYSHPGPLSDLRTDPNLIDEIGERIGQRFYAAGLGGSKNKLFFKCSDGFFILKNYEEEYIARSEANSLHAYEVAMSGKTDIQPYSHSFKTILACKRFDRTSDDQKFSICHAFDLDNSSADMRAGSYESILKNVQFYADAFGGEKQAVAINQQIVKRVIFAFVLGDNDLHKGNIAFRRAPAELFWNITPPYDVLPCTHEDRPRGASWKQTRLTIGNHGKTNVLNLKDFEELARKASLSSEEVRITFERSIKAVKDHVLPSLPKILQIFYQKHLDNCEIIMNGGTYPKGDNPSGKALMANLGRSTTFDSAKERRHFFELFERGSLHS